MLDLSIDCLRPVGTRRRRGLTSRKPTLLAPTLSGGSRDHRRSTWSSSPSFYKKARQTLWAFCGKMWCVRSPPRPRRPRPRGMLAGARERASVSEQCGGWPCEITVRLSPTQSQSPISRGWRGILTGRDFRSGPRHGSLSLGKGADDPCEIGAILFIADRSFRPRACAAQISPLLETDVPIGKRHVRSATPVPVAWYHPPDVALVCRANSGLSWLIARLRIASIAIAL